MNRKATFTVFIISFLKYTEPNNERTMLFF